jgi:uncharacterized repeat protein (TIGR01451 family)
VGESASYTCSHGGETASYYNFINAQAWSPAAGTYVLYNDTARVNVVPSAQSIMVTKEPANQTIMSGQPASFTITVTNTGNSALSPIMVRDTPATECNRNLSSLAPGISSIITCSHAGETASWDNVVSAIGYTPTGSTVMGNATAHVTVIPPASSIQATKSPANQTVMAGQPATFDISVANTGNVDLFPVLVYDSVAPECARNLSRLIPNGMVGYPCTHAGETASYTNFINVVGYAPDGTFAVSNASARVNVVSNAPSIMVTKEPANQTVLPGEPATFTITVTNTGDTVLNSLQVLDYPAPECARSIAGSLSPGGSTSYTCSHGGWTESDWNIATAIGYAPDGTQVMNNASARVTVVPATAAQGKITFSSNRDGNYDIYMMDADGSNLVQLTNNGAYNYHPALSPDGLKIDFASNVANYGNDFEIYTMDSDGSHVVQLTYNLVDDFAPVWSPDGTQIAFSNLTSNVPGDYRGSLQEIFVLNNDGSGLRRITDNGFPDHFPTWSPDGTKIAYSSYRVNRWDIYVKDLFSGSEVNLTQNLGSAGWYAAWSPDGTKIAYECTPTGSRQICVSDAQGTYQSVITASHGLGVATDPTWSPDGTKIAYMSDHDLPGIESGGYEIYVMDADGSNPTRLTNNLANDWYPAWGVS